MSKSIVPPAIIPELIRLNRRKSVILYLEMANNHRCRIFSMLANLFTEIGWSVSICCEERIAFRFSLDDDITVEDNRQRIHRWLDQSNGINTVSIDTYRGSSVNDLQSANQARKKKILSLIDRESPDIFIIWSGNFEYQAGTLDALSQINRKLLVLYVEVGWFPQRDFIYIDNCGVNAKCSLSLPAKKSFIACSDPAIDKWKNNYRREKTILYDYFPFREFLFIPLQVDSDTSIRLWSPFRSMQEFITFLESWIPSGFPAVIKVHPKSLSDFPLHSNRSDFKIISDGPIEHLILSSRAVIGINSTVLLESLALGKKTIAFGDGIFSGSGAIIRADKETPFATVMHLDNPDRDVDDLLYNLVFDRQISLRDIENKKIDTVAEYYPFRLLGDFLPYRPIEQSASIGKKIIRIGKTKIASTAVVRIDGCGGINIGNTVEVRHYSIISIPVSSNSHVAIGNHCVIGVGNVVNARRPVLIRDDVIVGPNSYIGFAVDRIDDPVSADNIATVIERDVWIGANCTIDEGVSIGPHSIIGANSHVSTNIPPYSIAVGCPAQIIRSRSTNQ